MRLDRVWVIYRADSQPAQREARQCAKELKALGSHVVTAMSGPRVNPFPGLLALLVRVVVTTPWSLPGPAAVGEEATARIGEHLFTDYLLPFEVASVLLLMAMIGAIVLARRDVLATDVVTGEVADQGLIEKARTPLLMNRAD